MARVLVVDDDPDPVMLVKLALESGGHEVIGAQNGQRGLELLAEAQDIILCDYNMPIMNGFEFCQRVRRDEQYKQYAKIPIIGIGDFPADKSEFLTDRLDKRQLLSKVSECVERYCK